MPHYSDAGAVSSTMIEGYMATVFSCDRCKRPVSDKSKLYDLSSCSRIKTRSMNNKIVDKRDSPTFKYEVCESCAIKIHKLILN